jgi:hypothetical protein
MKWLAQSSDSGFGLVHAPNQGDPSGGRRVRQATRLAAPGILSGIAHDISRGTMTMFAGADRTAVAVEVFARLRTLGIDFHELPTAIAPS